MDIIKITCVHCGHTYEENLINKESHCPNCYKTFRTAQGSKYYKSLQKIKKEDNKKAIGEAYKEVDLLIDKAEYYLDNEEFDNAVATLEEALKITTRDRRIYLLFVYAKTKNFTDLEDKSHYDYLKRVIELSNDNEKAELRKIYTAYYKKSTMTKEELGEYNDQLAEIKKERVETLLKDGIPKHFENEKTLKIVKILLPISLVLLISALVVYLIVDLMWVFYITAGLSVPFLFLFLQIINLQPKVNLYNTILDFYDNYPQFAFTTEQMLQVNKVLEKFSISFLNNESTMHLTPYIEELVTLIITFDNDKINEFILNYKCLKKYVELDEE